jgi:hypothetical protein
MLLKRNTLISQKMYRQMKKTVHIIFHSRLDKNRIDFKENRFKCVAVKKNKNSLERDTRFVKHRCVEKRTDVNDIKVRRRKVKREIKTTKQT